MTAPKADAAAAPMRPPEEVMRLERIGAFFPTRLSFMRALVRRLGAERASVGRPVWEIDGQGHGRAVYTVPLGGRAYSLAAFSTPLAPEDRTDRVIAEAWDTTYALFDGVPGEGDLARLEENVPRQEAGRCLASELVLSRANKSVRLFGHVAERLAAGRQPDEGMVRSIGYLMRTTAVYGNGKFGLADRQRLRGRPGMLDPFRAEMLAVWLIRGFTHDLVEHVARALGGQDAIALDRRLKRHLGIGNSTGLGMAPFLANHPALIHKWMHARESALAAVRARASAAPADRERLRELAAGASDHLEEWEVDDEIQMRRIRALRDEFRQIRGMLSDEWLAAPRPWERLMQAAAGRSLECQELVVALCLEPAGELVDRFADDMATDEDPPLDPSMDLAELGEILRENYGWALGMDFSDPASVERFWYVSEEKLEPRVGNRHLEPGSEKELPLDIARGALALERALRESDGATSVAEFLAAHPEHRHVVGRVQATRAFPYGEIRGNLIGAQCRPIDLLRCKLSFFGATKFDPKSDLWTRVVMFQGAPLADEIGAGGEDDWWLRALGRDEVLAQ